ncbi:hypothetical protein [Citrobacter werkmanii]|uniref:hypothetical protein n=1 Tax=Citrobacter werkmanii TaxID=67827 RepID=UPI001F43F62A|nr:hypothetical protein [Citrobacter werkmanii]
MTNESSANAIIGNTLRIIASGEYHPGAELTQKMASYIIELEQKLSDMAVQLANAESKCRVLAAENAGLKNFIINDCHVAHIESETFYEEEVTRYVSADGYEPETPATDAFLAEVRAQGVELFAIEWGGHDSPYGQDAYNFAAQLRKGVAL